jgi:hypothetical protein
MVTAAPILNALMSARDPYLSRKMRSWFYRIVSNAAATPAFSACAGACDSRQLSRLIGRPTTALSAVVAKEPGASRSHLPCHGT